MSAALNRFAQAKPSRGAGKAHAISHAGAGA
jgi:hypothetical protein